MGIYIYSKNKLKNVIVYLFDTLMYGKNGRGRFKLKKKICIISAVLILCIFLGGITLAGYMKSAKVKEQFNLGSKFLKEGKYEEAIIAFEKVIKIEPKNVEARVDMAKACIEVKKLELAEKMLKEAISIDTKNVEAYLLLGKLYVDTGRIEEAIALQDNGFNKTNNNEIKNFKEELSAILQKSKENYENAIKQMNEKIYLEAIDTFGRVDKRDGKRYSDSQSKILECKRLYINDNLKMAEESFKNNKFDEANVILGNIAKIDENNSEMLKLKSDIAKAVQKLNEEEEAKRAAIEKNKSKTLSLDIINTIINLNKGEIVKKLGNNYEIIPYGAEGWCRALNYKELGVIIAFKPGFVNGEFGIPDTSKVEWMDCDERVDINGARNGMNFEQVQNILGKTKVESYTYVPDGSTSSVTQFCIKYIIENCKVSFTASDSEGRKPSRYVSIVSAKSN